MSNPSPLEARESAGLFKPMLWTPGDWNAFFGFGTNILVNMLTLTGLLLFVLEMPPDMVFKHILPAAGLMMCMSTMYYAWLAYRLAKKTGRTDVCALPSGISVPHMFIVTLVIMLPMKLATAGALEKQGGMTPEQIKIAAATAGWQAGLVWVFVQSFVLMGGGFLAPIIRRITPKAALLGALAGVAITFISMKPALEMFITPVIGVVCFSIILLSWFGGVKYRGIPAGLVAIAAGTLIAWGSNLLPASYQVGGLSIGKLRDSFQTFGFSIPTPGQPSHLIFSGLNWALLSKILVTAIPFGIYDLVEAMDNVVSASAAGDDYPTTRVLTADGIVSLIGCMVGNPYINAVYIGHPGWKAMGGRIGYSAATGVLVIVLSWFGVISLMTALIPVVAISPILLYIGMLIGSQAFEESPKRHGPAIIVALVPSLAAWGLLQINNSLGAVSGIHHVTPEMIASMAKTGIFYEGLSILGGGSILSGVILSTITVFIIDRKYLNASMFALAGSVLTLFGLMHGEEIGFGQNPKVCAAYFLVGGFLFATAMLSPPVQVPEVEPEHEEGEHAVAAVPAKA